MTELPDNHRRSLMATAQFVEESIDELERLLNGSYAHHRMRVVETRFTEPQKESIKQALDRLRDANNAMCRDLDLMPRRLTDRQIAEAIRTHLWTVLEDSRSESMHGYGALTEEQSRRIDAHVDALLALVRSLSEV